MSVMRQSFKEHMAILFNINRRHIGFWSWSLDTIAFYNFSFLTLTSLLQF